jgi:hypothetical protein
MGTIPANLEMLCKNTYVSKYELAMVLISYQESGQFENDGFTSFTNFLDEICFEAKMTRASIYKYISICKFLVLQRGFSLDFVSQTAVQRLYNALPKLRQLSNEEIRKLIEENNY